MNRNFLLFHSFFILSPIAFLLSLLSFSFSSTIGVKGLLKVLPGGDVAACTRVGFSNLEILHSCSVDIDTGTLAFVCDLRHTEAFNAVRACPLDRAAVRAAAS